MFSFVKRFSDKYFVNYLIYSMFGCFAVTEQLFYKNIRFKLRLGFELLVDMGFGQNRFIGL